MAARSQISFTCWFIRGWPKCHLTGANCTRYCHIQTVIIKVNIADREPVRELGLATENYVTPLKQNDFLLYLRNSVFVTFAATVITLLTNSMAAFALSKYKFPGRDLVLMLIVLTASFLGDGLRDALDPSTLR